MRGTENLNATRRSICGPLPIPFLNAGMKIALQGEEDEVCHALVVRDPLPGWNPASAALRATEFPPRASTWAPCLRAAGTWD